VPQQRIPTEEIVRHGEEIYERDLRARFEKPENIGRLLLIDVETGDYELGAEDMEATDRLLARHPDAQLYFLRVGSDSAFDLFTITSNTKGDYVKER
jgi:hypothetical protein